VDVIPTSLAAPVTPYTKLLVLHFHRFISLGYKVIGFMWRCSGMFSHNICITKILGSFVSLIVLPCTVG
jgi:hypothetical protein